MKSIQSQSDIFTFFLKLVNQSSTVSTVSIHTCWYEYRLLVRTYIAKSLVMCRYVGIMTTVWRNIRESLVKNCGESHAYDQIATCGGETKKLDRNRGSRQWYV